MALSFRVARLQFNGANMNASPDTSTPAWPSISVGTDRGRGGERESNINWQNEREILPNHGSLSHWCREGDGVGVQRRRDPDTITTWSSITPESRARDGAEADWESDSDWGFILHREVCSNICIMWNIRNNYSRTKLFGSTPAFEFKNEDRKEMFGWGRGGSLM